MDTEHAGGAPGGTTEHLLVTLGIVSGGHFLSHLYILAYPPLFPLLIDDFGLNNTQLGLIMSVVALATFIFQTPVGELVDRVGAKRVFVVGVALASGGTALVGLAPSYPALVTFALLAGIGQAAFHPANYSLLNAVTRGDREGKSFGVHSFAGYAGFAVAPALVGGIGIAYGWQAALFAIGGFGLAYAAVAQILMPPVHRNRMAELELDRASDEDGSADGGADDEGGLLGNMSALINPMILALFAFFVVVTMANKGIQTFTTVFVADGLALQEVVGNTALTAYFTLAALGVLVGGVLADRYDVRWLIVGTLTTAAAMTWAGTFAAATATVVVALFAAIGFFYGLALPSRDRLISSISTAETTGKSFGFVYTGLPLGGFISPALLGALIDFTGVPALAFALVGLLYLIAAAIVAAVALGVRRPSPSLGGVLRRS